MRESHGVGDLDPPDPPAEERLVELSAGKGWSDGLEPEDM